MLPLRNAVVALVLTAAGACAPRAVEEAPGRFPLPRTEPEVRVGLLVDTATVELTAPQGFVITASDGEGVVTRGAPGQVIRISAEADGTLLASDGAGNQLAGQAGPWVARTARGDALLAGGKPYRGRLLLQAASPGRVTAINVVELEKYLLGVVPHEIGKVGPDLLEAARAQAVAARTYAIAHRGRRSSRGFDFYATVADQVYGGSESEHEVTSRAVQETSGEVLTYGGVPIEAYYHSTCAGRTAAIEEVWDDAPRPYLISVIDVNPATGVAYDSFSSRFTWTERWSAAQLEQILSRTLADSLPDGVAGIGELRDLRVEERTPSGRVRALRIEAENGTFVVGGDRVRWILMTNQDRLLNSSKFDVRVARDAAGRISEVIAEGGGWGHGIGMCQVGAMGRARAGQSYRTILDAYYPTTDLQKLY